MGIISSTDLKPENSDHESQNKQVHSEKVGDSSGDDWREGYEAFIKGGACKEAFMDMQDCVEEAEKKEEGLAQCFTKLDMCMEAHSDYYQPVLTAHKAALKVGEELAMKAFMPSAVDGLDEVYEEEEAKFMAFMEGGACKESFNAYLDCNDEVEKNRKEDDSDDFSTCAGLYGKLVKCVDAHSDYYHPLLTVIKTAEELMENEIKAPFSKAT